MYTNRIFLNISAFFIFFSLDVGFWIMFTVQLASNSLANYNMYESIISYKRLVVHAKKSRIPISFTPPTYVTVDAAPIISTHSQEKRNKM